MAITCSGVHQRLVDKDAEREVDNPPFSAVFPYIGVVYGVFSGSVHRWVKNLPLEFTNNVFCKKEAYKGYPILETINTFKQKEIKAIALLTPFLLPFSIQVVLDTVHGNKEETIFSRIYTAFQRNLTVEQITDLAAIYILGIVKVYQPSDFLSESFDASGHMMLKVSTLFLASKTITVLSKRGNQRLRNLYFAVNAIADAVLVVNTVKHCHTVPELVAGTLWGFGIIGISRVAAKAIRTFQGMTKSDRLDTLYDASVRLLSSSPRKAMERIDFFKRFAGMPI